MKKLMFVMSCALIVIFATSCSNDGEINVAKTDPEPLLSQEEQESVKNYYEDVGEFLHSVAPLMKNVQTRAGIDEIPTFTEEEKQQVMAFVSELDAKSQNLIHKLGISKEETDSFGIETIPLAASLIAMSTVTGLEESKLIEPVSWDDFSINGTRSYRPSRELQDVMLRCLLEILGLDVGSMGAAILMKAAPTLSRAASKELLKKAIIEIMENVVKRCVAVAAGNVAVITALVFQYCYCLHYNGIELI